MIVVVVVLQDFKEKNMEHMRPEVVSLFRSSERAVLHHLVASSPHALFRWGVLRATIRIVSVFKYLGRQRAEQCRLPSFTKMTAWLWICFCRTNADYSRFVCLAEWLSSSFEWWLDVSMYNWLVVSSPQWLPDEAPAKPSESWNSATAPWTDCPGKN